MAFTVYRYSAAPAGFSLVYLQNGGLDSSEWVKDLAKSQVREVLWGREPAYLIKDGVWD